MRFLLLNALACLTALSVQAQLVVSPSQLTFGANVQVGTTDSLLLTVTNTSPDSVFVNAYIQSVYGTNPAATTAQLEQVLFVGINGLQAEQLTPGQARSFYVYFRPMQNISYASHLVFAGTGTVGATSVPCTGTGRFSTLYSATQDLSED